MMMIGISKYNNKKQYTQKQIKKAFDAQSKSNAKGSAITFCDCGLPINKNNYHLITGEDGSKTPKIQCALCFHPSNLDYIASGDMGFLIFAPDITQEQINSLILMTEYIKTFDKDELLELTLDMESTLRGRQDLMESIYGEGTSDPSIFCQFLYTMEEEEYHNRINFVKNLRFVPSPSIIRNEVKYYSSNVLEKFNPKKWRSLLQSITKK